MATERLRGEAVVVGAGLAGLRGAEAMRSAGFEGRLTILGDEPYRPYDRPPLSKHVLTGHLPADVTQLPSTLGDDVEWRLGAAATGLDRERRVVRLADGDTLSYDALLIASGTRARPWVHEDEGRIPGVFTIRGRDDAAALRAALAAAPRRVAVIGAGFIGCEVASVCRELDVPVSLIDPSPSPLSRVIGRAVGDHIGEVHRSRGVDLRMNCEADHLESSGGRFSGVLLKDGTRIAADVAVVALGAVRNTEWLEGSGLLADAGGIDCDEHGYVTDEAGRPDSRIVAAGDVARFPHLWRSARRFGALGPRRGAGGACRTFARRRGSRTALCGRPEFLVHAGRHGGEVRGAY